jgi:hypothetical protein
MAMHGSLQAAVLVLVAAAALAPGVAQARRDGYWDEVREDRRDARRAGVIAGAITYGVVRSAQQQDVREEEDDCIRDTGDYEYCDRLGDREERQDRSQARRTAVVIGATTRAVVRDKRRRDRWDD